jgi:hypothetical protein
LPLSKRIIEGLLKLSEWFHGILRTYKLQFGIILKVELEASNQVLRQQQRLSFRANSLLAKVKVYYEISYIVEASDTKAGSKFSFYAGKLSQEQGPSAFEAKRTKLGNGFYAFASSRPKQTV